MSDKRSTVVRRKPAVMNNSALEDIRKMLLNGRDENEIIINNL